MAKSEYQKLSETKKKAKDALFAKGEAGPLMLIFAHQKEQELLFKLLEGCLVLPGQIIVITNNVPADAVKKPHSKITFVNNLDSRDTAKIDQYLTAADMAVVFEEHLGEVKNLMHHGIVVIGHEKSPLLNNYHPNEETGNSFTFDSYNPWSVFMALVRAHETFRFPYDWGNIIRGMVKKV